MLLVQSISDNKQFHQFLRPLSKNNNKSTISKALVDATHYLLNNNIHLHRRRRRFLPSQIERLETEFTSIKYISKQFCVTLAQDLQLDDCKVKQWFARRRMKYKREVVNIVPFN